MEPRRRLLGLLCQKKAKGRWALFTGASSGTIERHSVLLGALAICGCFSRTWVQLTEILNDALSVKAANLMRGKDKFVGLKKDCEEKQRLDFAQFYNAAIHRVQKWLHSKLGSGLLKENCSLLQNPWWIFQTKATDAGQQHKALAFLLFFTFTHFSRSGHCWQGQHLFPLSNLLLNCLWGYSEELLLQGQWSSSNDEHIHYWVKCFMAQTHQQLKIRNIFSKIRMQCDL